MGKKKTVQKFIPQVAEPEEDDMLEPLIDDEPIADNAIDVPMFADIDGRTSRSITKLKLTKIEPGGPPAYKGMIPVNSTLDTIGQMFGDGIYTIEGMNNKHTTLAVKENVRISLGHKDPATQIAPINPDVSERIERMARESAQESKERSSEFLKLVVTTLESARERESNMHAANMAMMGQFFTNIQTAAATQFQQTLLMLTTGHRQTLEQMAVVEDGRERRQLAAGKKKEDGGETKLVDMLLRGMRLANDMQSGNQPQMWEQLLGAGAGLLSKVNVGTTPPPAPTPAALAPPAPAGPAPRVLSRKAKDTIQKALRLYREVRSRGIDPNVLLASLSEVGSEQALPAVPPPETPDEENDPDESDESESEEDFDDEDSDDESDDEEDDDESDSEHGELRT